MQRVSSNEKTGFHSSVSMKELPRLVLSIEFLNSLPKLLVSPTGPMALATPIWIVALYTLLYNLDSKPGGLLSKRESHRLTRPLEIHYKGGLLSRGGLTF